MNKIDWQIVLKVWAVLGPLIAGGVSAAWSRRNQLQDRKHDVERQQIAREELVQDRETDFRRNNLSSRKAELRLALANFVAASNDYIKLCQTNAETKGNNEIKILELEALARMNANFQMVSVLGTNEIAELAKRVLNHASDFPHQTKKFKNEEEALKHRDEFLVAKQNLATAVRKLFGIENEA